MSNATMSRSSNVVKCNNVEDVNLCQMQQCRRCQSLSNVTMSKMSIFVKCNNVEDVNLCQMQSYNKIPKPPISSTFSNIL